MEPLIRSKSLILCRAEHIPVEKAKWRHIYCVNLPGEGGAVLKKIRYDKKSGQALLFSINLAEEPVVVRRADAHIIGRAVGVVWQGL